MSLTGELDFNFEFDFVHRFDDEPQLAVRSLVEIQLAIQREAILPLM
jgi:hypothetical protein